MWPFSQTHSQPDTAPEQRNLADPSDWLLEVFGATPSLSGVGVTPQNAMKCTAVRSAVEAVCEAVGGLPLHVYEKGAGDSRSRANGHPAYALLREQANDWTPAPALIEQVTRDALLWGNGFAFINRADGIPRELIRLQPNAVTVELDTLASEPIYRLTAGTQQRIIDRRDVLHIAAPSIDGVSGASPVTQCREAIALCMTMERHAARLFGRGARPSGLLSFPQKLGADTAKRIKASWQAAHAGEASGGTAVLEDGGTFQALTLNSVDAQFLQIWQHSILEICRIYRVPPHLVFELGRATWSNAAEMGASFLRFTLDRWLKAWQGEVRLKLIAPEDRDRFYAEFLTDDLLRSDFATRATAYGQYRSMGVMTANEVRAGLNLAPLPEGDTLQNPYTTSTTPGAADE